MPWDVSNSQSLYRWLSSVVPDNARSRGPDHIPPPTSPVSSTNHDATNTNCNNNIITIYHRCCSLKKFEKNKHQKSTWPFHESSLRPSRPPRWTSGCLELPRDLCRAHLTPAAARSTWQSDCWRASGSPALLHDVSSAEPRQSTPNHNSLWLLRSTTSYKYDYHNTPCLKKTSKIIFVMTTSNFQQIWQFLAQRWQIV